MKIIICFAFLMWVPFVNAQFIDDFSDGDFLVNPTWEGQVDSFEVLSQEVHLNALPNSSESYLVTSSHGAVSGFWEFELRMDFNPSSSNRAKVYLMSDTNNLQAPLSGYFVMLGNTDDEVSLYKQTGTSSIKIIDGQDGVLNQSLNHVRVKVERDALGNFTLYADTSLGFGNYLLQGNVLDNSFLSCTYFGILCDYTATRSDKFWFDNFEVSAQVYVDQSPPTILSHSIPQLNKLTLFFNETLDSNFAVLPTNYFLNGSINPYSVSIQGQELTLNFSQNFQNDFPHQIQILAKDLTGNLFDTLLPFSFQDNIPFHGVIFNEIYADESPSYGMPAYEFLELKNTTNDTLFLENWSLADASDTVTLPNDTLFPLDFLLLCKTTAVPSYLPFGRCLGVPNFPSLNNTGDQLILFNRYDLIVDSLSYNNSWYANQTDSLGNNKNDGGFSLERIAISAPCSDRYNWFPSVDHTGASPGATNSIANYVFPSLMIAVEDVIIDNDTTLIVHLNYEAPFLNEQHTSIANLGIEQAFSFDGLELFVHVDQPLQSGNSYEIQFSNVLDCRGMPVPDFSYTFYMFEWPSQGDIIINEILFNPRTGGSDYLELYNKSDKLINLKSFQILEYDPLDPQTVVDKVNLGETIIAPKDYVVFSEDTADVFLNYIVLQPDKLFQVSLPNFNDDQSILTLNLPDGTMLDSLAYHKSWHLELLDVEDGSALERIDPFRKTNDADNWQTAAKTYGFGSPTAKNSQYFERDLSSQVKVEPEVFTPNEDGYKDFCLISYLEGSPGEIANITIYNLLGQEVKLIAQNHSLGQENTWKWNGTNNDFEKADVGIYIVLFEIFDLEGKKQRIKEKVVLGTPLN